MQRSTTHRIDLLLNALNVSQSEFAEKLGITPNNVTNMKQRDLSSRNIEKIVKAYPQISREWLMTGEGLPIKTNQIVNEAFSPTGDEKRDRQLDTLSQTIYKPTRTYDSRTGVPYYDVCFELGFDLMENDQTKNPSYYVDFQPFNKADCWCTSKGNSMHPTISNGDAVALKRIYDFSMLISNEVYGLVAKNGLRTIKRIVDQGENFLLKADNPEYPEQVIKREDVMYIYKVVGSVKMF